MAPVSFWVSLTAVNIIFVGSDNKAPKPTKMMPLVVGGRVSDDPLPGFREAARRIPKGRLYWDECAWN